MTPRPKAPRLEHIIQFQKKHYIQLILHELSAGTPVNIQKALRGPPRKDQKGT